MEHCECELPSTIVHSECELARTIFHNTLSMEMMLKTRLPIVKALLIIHHLSLLVVAFTTSNKSTGFSFRLVAKNAIHRHDDGFLHLHHIPPTNLQPQPPSFANSSVPIVTPLHSETETFEPLQNSHSVITSFGTGRGLRSYYLKVDTAVNSITWIQCVPCVPHAPQHNEIFNFALSPTIQNIPSTSLVCAPPLGSPSGEMCAFERTGPRGMLVKGFLQEDHVTTADGSIIQNYVFGCSHSTTNFNSEGKYAGVMSVGRSPHSLVMQVAARGLTQFSYCLIGGSKTNRHGYLRFGSDIPNNLHYRTTRILPMLKGHESEYYLSLIGIRLGGQKLDGINPKMFARSKDKKGGCVIDISTPYTIMFQDAYDIVEEALWLNLQHQNVERVDRPEFGLCFRATKYVKESFNSLSLHFSEEEAVLVFLPKQLFLMMHDPEGQVACFAMKPGNRTVIGAFQQVDTRFVYDVKDSKLSFASELCTQDADEID